MVTRLKPRQGSYEEALRAFRSGDFSSCLDLLGDSTVIEAAILRARSLVRIGDAASAVETLSRDEYTDLSHEHAAEALSVISYALHVLKRPAEASAVAIEARARCFSSGQAGIEGELLFSSAIGALLIGDFASAEAAAEAILALEDARPAWVSLKNYAYTLPYWRARACDVLGAIEGVRANYGAYASWLRKSFGEFDAAGVRDEYVHVGLLANYADAAITLGGDDVVEFVLARAESISWNSSLAVYEFRVFSALAEASSASGDHIAALRFFRRCLDCAPNTVLQIRAGIERAKLLREIGESFSSREEIDHAVRLSRAVNWELTNVLEQRQLLLLAAQVASFDGAAGAKLLVRFDELSGNTLNGVSIKDERARGEELVARAAVMRAVDREDRAIILLIDALATFTAAGLANKVGLVAAELAELTSEPHYVAIARAQVEKQPQSILARKMARYDAYEFRPGGSLPAASQADAPSRVVAFARPKLSLLS